MTGRGARRYEAHAREGEEGRKEGCKERRIIKEYETQGEGEKVRNKKCNWKKKRPFLIVMKMDEHSNKEIK